MSSGTLNLTKPKPKPDGLACYVGNVVRRCRWGLCLIISLWMRPTTYSRHVSIRKAWRQSAVTPWGGTQCIQLAGGYATYITLRNNF